MTANERQVGGNHYNTPIQHWDYVIANDIPYLEAQVIKYVVRHKKKNGVQDLEKAKHFLEKLIEVENARAATHGVRIEVTGGGGGPSPASGGGGGSGLPLPGGGGSGPR